MVAALVGSTLLVTSFLFCLFFRFLAFILQLGLGTAAAVVDILVILLGCMAFYHTLSSFFFFCYLWRTSWVVEY